MKRKKSTSMPRRTLKNRKPSWRILVIDDDGKRIVKMYFGAFGGGEAKAKALAKLQSFFRNSCFSSNLHFKGLLEKQDSNGNNGGVPSYVFRERCSYLGNLLQARRASQVFKTCWISEAQAYRINLGFIVYLDKFELLFYYFFLKINYCF